jgi:hypothetical protein
MYVDLPPDLPPVIILAKAQQDQTVANAPRAIGWCLIRENNPGQLYDPIPISFAAAAANYMGLYEYEEGNNFSEKNAKVTIIQLPQHGQMINIYEYIPAPGYYGLDKVIAQVELASGEKVTVAYFIHMVHLGIQESEESIREFCGPKGEYWKISLSESVDAVSLLDGLNLTFSDLLGSAVAQTTGTQITLDTNTAGYGWFIDYTPYLNEEWLPTSSHRLGFAPLTPTYVKIPALRRTRCPWFISR